MITGEGEPTPTPTPTPTPSTLWVTTETISWIAWEQITQWHLVKSVSRDSVNQYKYELWRYTTKRTCNTIIGNGNSSNSISLYLKKEWSWTPSDITVTISDSNDTEIATTTISSSDVSTSWWSVTANFSDGFTLELQHLYKVSLEVSELDNDNYYLVNENWNVENWKTFDPIYFQESDFTNVYALAWNDSIHGFEKNTTTNHTFSCAGTSDIVMFDFNYSKYRDNYYRLDINISFWWHTIIAENRNNNTSVTVDWTNIWTLPRYVSDRGTYWTFWMDFVNGKMFFSSDYVRWIETLTYNIWYSKLEWEQRDIDVSASDYSTAMGFSTSNMIKWIVYKSNEELKINWTNINNIVIVNSIPPLTDIAIAQNNANIWETVIIETGWYSSAIQWTSWYVYLSNDWTTTTTVTNYRLWRITNWMLKYEPKLSITKPSINTDFVLNKDAIMVCQLSYTYSNNGRDGVTYKIKKWWNDYKVWSWWNSWSPAQYFNWAYLNQTIEYHLEWWFTYQIDFDPNMIKEFYYVN